MKWLPKHKTNWLIRLLFIIASWFIFQSSIAAAAVNIASFKQEHHTGISEGYTYDEIESSVWTEVDRTDRLSAKK